ncbi:MAG TPA: DUF2911 domain-containing protein [Opitutaceae bacterium]
MNTRPLLTVLSGLVLATGLFAQAPQIEFPAPSPAASFKQRVGITDVSVEYSRPSVRGRVIFGGLVPYGEVWRTGANSATKITFSTDVKLGGANVAAGTYALFTIPGENEWTIILNNVTGQWGSYAYNAENDVVRVTAKPAALTSPVETFSIGVSNLSAEGSATLYLLWENTRVPVKIETDLAGMLVPKIEAVLASDAEKKPYFQAAMFYYENGLDLNKALEWMNTAIAASPGQMWMVYRKGLILAKMGDKAGALAAANESLELIGNSPAGTPKELIDEYTRLNEALIKSLK